MRKFAFVATTLIAGALSGCLANQRRQQYAQASAQPEQTNLEKECQKAFTTGLLAPSMNGFSGSVSNALIAKSQCMHGQPISLPQPPIVQPSMQPNLGQTLTCNSFGSTTQCY